VLIEYVSTKFRIVDSFDVNVLCVFTPLIVSQDGGLEAWLGEAFLMPMIALLGCWWGRNSLSVPARKIPTN
jgi:hypothetical protein